MAEFIAHIRDGNDEPKVFDEKAVEQYVKDREIHKLMGGLMQTLVDNKPTDPVDFLVDTLTQMEKLEAAALENAEAEERAVQAAVQAEEQKAKEQPDDAPAAPSGLAEPEPES